jgi:NTE family protein
LVLGSGGARGLAHIGVIRWLAENGYAIRSISGTSIGAFIGGVYAAGKLEVYAEWVLALERLHVLRLLDPAIGKPGLFKGDRVISVMRELIGDHAIEDLPIAYTAVATDMHSREEVWLREGPLFDAIRASIATPLVFTPFRHGNRTLLDGALVNPVPIAPTLEDDTDLTIAVDLSGPEESRVVPHAAARVAARHGKRARIARFIDNLRPARTTAEPRHGLMDVAFSSMQTMQDTISSLRLAAFSPDVKVDIPRNACGFFEFWRAADLIALGRERAARAFAGLEHSAPRAAGQREGAAALPG